MCTMKVERTDGTQKNQKWKYVWRGLQKYRIKKYGMKKCRVKKYQIKKCRMKKYRIKKYTVTCSMRLHIRQERKKQKL